MLCVGSQGSQLKELKYLLVCHLEVVNPHYSNFLKDGMEAGTVCQRLRVRNGDNGASKLRSCVALVENSNS